MQIMCLFDKFPDDLIITILIDWLTNPNDVIAFDMSMQFNRVFSRRYFKCLHVGIPSMSMTLLNMKDSMRLAKWQSCRKVNVPSVAICCEEDLKNFKLGAIHWEYFRRLKSLTIGRKSGVDCLYIDIAFLLKALPCLESLSIYLTNKTQSATKLHSGIDLTYQNNIHIHSSLKQLTLRDIPLNVKKAIGSAHWIVYNCPLLQTLEIHECKGMIPEVILYLLHHISTLHTLYYLDSTVTMIHSSIHYFTFHPLLALHSFTFLTPMLSSTCSNVYTLALLPYLPKLCHLAVSLGNISNVEDLLLTTIRTHWSHLVSLLIEAYDLSDKIIETVCTTCRLLQRLSLYTTTTSTSTPTTHTTATTPLTTTTSAHSTVTLSLPLYDDYPLLQQPQQPQYHHGHNHHDHVKKVEQQEVVVV